MDVSNIAGIGAMDEWRTTDMIPHLARSHSKNEKLQKKIEKIHLITWEKNRLNSCQYYQRHYRPHGFVIQKLKVVSS